MYIGLQRIPVTGQTKYGSLTITVHITYVSINGHVQIWETWLNPAFKGQLDAVDRLTFAVSAERRLLATVKIREINRSWEGVLYG